MLVGLLMFRAESKPMEATNWTSTRGEGHEDNKIYLYLSFYIPEL